MALAAGAMLGLLAGTAGASIAKADDLPLLDTLSDAQTYYMINYIEQIQERFFGLTWTNSIYYRKLLEKPISLDAVEQNNIIDKATADAVVARDRGWAWRALSCGGLRPFRETEGRLPHRNPRRGSIGAIFHRNLATRTWKLEPGAIE
jgi:hypothetical protein